MKRTNILYWTFTVLFAGLMIASSISNIIVSDTAVQAIHQGLGYPIYILPFIGIAKTIAAIAILIPGFPRVKEWAYAGLFIDLAGACFSIAMVGGAPLFAWAIMALHIIPGILSYVYYHRRNAKLHAAGKHVDVLPKAMA